MGENSKIAWCDHTFNIVEGCEKISPACANCYAWLRDKRFHGGKHWGKHAPRKMMSEAYWKQPLKWDRKAKESGKPETVFCSSLADVFEDHPDLVRPRERLWKNIEATPNLIYLLLTKRPENIVWMYPQAWLMSAPANVWLGTTVENCAQYRRLRHLTMVPAVVYFISAEPLLSPLSVADMLCNVREAEYWMIVGGESGAHARPMDLEWVRSIRDACKCYQVPFFFKQGSEANWPDFEDFDKMPEEFRVREYPALTPQALSTPPQPSPMRGGSRLGE
jgi:protein gp37